MQSIRHDEELDDILFSQEDVNPDLFLTFMNPRVHQLDSGLLMIEQVEHDPFIVGNNPPVGLNGELLSD